MQHFSLHIDVAHAAMAENRDGEISRILRRLADKVELGVDFPADGALLDINGNAVGTWSLWS